jgi:hypothetical protein
MRTIYNIATEQITVDPDFVPEPVAPPPPQVPVSVWMRQARLALLSIGKLEDVEAAIAQAGAAAQIEWEYAHEVRRDAGLVIGIGAALGLTEAEIDALFIHASTL